MAVYLRGKVYYMDFMVNGKRVYKSTKKRTKSQALEAEQKERVRLEALNESKESVMTLDRAAQIVFEDRWKRQASGQQSLNRVLLVCQKYSNPYLNEIDSNWIRGLRRYLDSQSHSEATQNRYLAHIKTVLRIARDEWEVIDRIPKISLEKEHEGRLRVLSETEVERITKLLRSQEKTSRRKHWPLVADLVEFLVDTGMRLSEAINIGPDNLTAEGRIKLFPKQTKSRRPRVIPMTSRAQEIVKRLGDRPFQGLDIYKADRAFKWAKKELKITDPDFTLHSCRHTFASNLLNKGADLYTVQKLLGHASPTTTQRYAHLQVDTLTNAVSLLE